jgi:hypothetical protein
MASCVKHELTIKHVNEKYDIENQKIKNKKENHEIFFNEFQNEFSHVHESLIGLRNRFGNEHEVISVKRNKYERFFSLWKHILHEMDLKLDNDTFQKCEKLNADEILFYNNYNLLDSNDVNKIVDEFILKNELTNINDYGKNMLKILVRPYSTYHLHDQNIIWFDFNELNKLEEWVSNKLKIDFKLLKINSSQQYKSNFILDDYFRTKYDSIYKIYDEIKTKKTIL